MTDPFRLRMELSLLQLGAGRSRSAHAAITGLGDPERNVQEALANLEEHSPEEAALLREHVNCGRSTDPR